MKHYVKSYLYANKERKNTAEYLGTNYDGDLSVDPPMPVDDNDPWVWVDAYDTYPEAVEAMAEIENG